MKTFSVMYYRSIMNNKQTRECLPIHEDLKQEILDYLPVGYSFVHDPKTSGFPGKEDIVELLRDLWKHDNPRFVCVVNYSLICPLIMAWANVTTLRDVRLFSYTFDELCRKYKRTIWQNDNLSPKEVKHVWKTDPFCLALVRLERVFELFRLNIDGNLPIQSICKKERSRPADTLVDVGAFT